MAKYPWLNPQTLYPFSGSKADRKKLRNINEVKQFWETYYQYKLYSYALSKYQWLNLPKKGLSHGLTGYKIEQQLADNGDLYVYRETKTDSIVFASGDALGRNMYDNPTSVLINQNGLPKVTLQQKEFVYMQDTTLGLPTWFTILAYARNLASLKARIEKNISVSTAPIVVSTDKKQVEQVKEQIESFEDGDPVIITDSHLKLGDPNFKVTSLPFNDNYVADKIRDQFDKVWNDALRDLGVNTIDIVKKERLTTAEAHGNDDVISRVIDEGLDYRQAAVTEINRRFGTNINVVANVNNTPVATDKEESNNGNSQGLQSKESDNNNPDDAK